MKKTLLSILICFMITSCYPTQAPSIFIGMSVEEFTVKTNMKNLLQWTENGWYIKLFTDLTQKIQDSTILKIINLLKWIVENVQLITE